MQSRPIATWRFTTSATTGTICAATSSPPTSPRARRRAVSSKPEGTGSRPTWLVRIFCALFFIGLPPRSLELFQSDRCEELVRCRQTAQLMATERHNAIERRGQFPTDDDRLAERFGRIL